MKELWVCFFFELVDKRLKSQFDFYSDWVVICIIVHFQNHPCQFQLNKLMFIDQEKHTYINELPHDKANKMARTSSEVSDQTGQISLGICPVWSESSLSTWRKLRSLATHWAHSEDSDQTGRMPRLIWVFAGHTVILLVLSWGGSSPSVCGLQENCFLNTNGTENYFVMSKC